jgi:Protein of unknown function (DUF3892)
MVCLMFDSLAATLALRRFRAELFTTAGEEDVAHLEVTCITKRLSHSDPHERIQALGGSSWSKVEDAVIREIERGANSYYVKVAGRSVQVVVSTRRGRKYLKTTADTSTRNNLLALPECPR